MRYTTIESRFDATELVNLLTSEHRDKPVVVISSTKQGPRISPGDVAVRVAGVADVYLLANAGISYLMEELMPPETNVYGGAARTYPAHTDWIQKHYQATVRLAYSDEEAARAVEQIGADADKMAKAHSASSAAPVKSVRKAPVSGVISMMMEFGAVVKLEESAPTRMARIDTSAFAPGIPAGQLMHVGMKVYGVLAGGILDVSAMLNTPADAVDYAEEATIQAAMVLDGKSITLFPGLNIRHRTEEEAGTVIAVEIDKAGRADGKEWRVTTVYDIEPDEVSEALPMFRGAGPWISLPEPAPDVLEDEPAPDFAGDAFAAWERVRLELATLTETNRSLTSENDALRCTADVSTQVLSASPVPTAVVGGADLDRAHREIARLDRAHRDMLAAAFQSGRDADALAAENAKLVQVNARLREDIRTERDRANRARQLSRESVQDSAAALFADPEEQFRFDVLHEWAVRIPASSKKELPLATYDLDPEFLPSVRSLHGIDRSKIVAVAVEVLTGLADRSSGRAMHLMREGSTDLVPPAGAGKLWRVSLQDATAGARRLHFWRGTGGHVTFAHVGVHDEVLS